MERNWTFEQSENGAKHRGTGRAESMVEGSAPKERQLEKVYWLFKFVQFRRGGRVVEGARLESVYTVYSRIEGSKPSLSAK